MSNRQITACFYIDKGGVGKTTGAAHLARGLVEETDLDVLLIDLAGRQNDLAIQFGLSDAIEDIDAPVSAIFRDDWEFIRGEIDDVVDRMIVETGAGVDLIPSDPGLEGADADLTSVPLEERFIRLREFLTADLGAYDAILIDLPGKETNISLNGLVAAENVVAPVKPGPFERTQLDRLPETLEEIGTDTPVGPELVMIMPNAVDSQKIVHQEFLEDLEERYADLTAPKPIPNSANVEAAPTHGRTIFDMDDDELYATGKRARTAFRTNAAELKTRLS